jgi:hypothetical protein
MGCDLAHHTGDDADEELGSVAISDPIWGAVRWNQDTVLVEYGAYHNATDSPTA